MDYNDKTLEQLYQHVLKKREAHKRRPLEYLERTEARCFFLAGVIIAKGLSRDTKKVFTSEFNEELTSLIEAQLETDLVVTMLNQIEKTPPDLL